VEIIDYLDKVIHDIHELKMRMVIHNIELLEIKVRIHDGSENGIVTPIKIESRFSED
jgi:hypothetical protein